MSDLPFVDQHRLTVRAGADQVWAAVMGYAGGLGPSRHKLLSLVLGAEPPSGFAVVDTQPPRELTLAGRHRFAQYQLVFRVIPEGEEALLTADTYARFPGVKGRLYRAALMPTGGHRIATRRMLATIRRRAEATAAS